MNTLYQSHFGLAAAPFSIAPDPRFLYMSQGHQEALAHLLYGLERDGGFVLLTGEVGAGKTTLCRCLLEQIPASCDVAYIFNPRLSELELLSTICTEFGIDHPAGNTSIKVFIDGINRHLLAAHAQGRHTILIIDEAQNLSAEVLEQMRLLTNLETNQQKLLQIILLGQPELATLLERPELRQLAQRIVARYHLGALAKAEVAAYVSHRLEISGARHTLFPASLIGRLHRLSGGVPRIINVLCDRALLGAYVQGQERVRRSTLNQAAREALEGPAAPRSGQRRLLMLTALLTAGIAASAALYLPTAKHAHVLPAHQAIPAVAMQVAMPLPPPIAPPKPLETPQPPPLPTTLEWPAAQADTDSLALANAALFRAWGAKAPGERRCRQAEKLGLRCLTSRGGLLELRQINRPAVLTLHSERGEVFHATLTALDDKSASFKVGTETRTVSLSALATQWTGEYTLLWRMQPEIPGTLHPGKGGPAVQWLSRQLDIVQGKVAHGEGPVVFDNTLMHRLKQFQLAQGLPPDGTLRPSTLMRLNSHGDPKAPELRPATEED